MAEPSKEGGIRVLEKIDLSKQMEKKEYESLLKELGPKLSYLQRQCKELQIPVMVVFEGWKASGKGIFINNVIEPMDPRGFNVFTTENPIEVDKRYPFLWRYFTNIPAKGRITFFDQSWYKRVMYDRLDQITSSKELQYAFDEIINFEQLLTADGIIIIKFFLHISKEEQTKRFDELVSKEETAWRVTSKDWERNEKYEEYLTIFDEMLAKTDREYAPWYIIESNDISYATAKIMTTMVNCLGKACNEKINEVRKQTKLQEKGKKKEKRENIPLVDRKLGERFLNGVLNGVDLNKDIEKSEYKERLKDLQERLGLLHADIHRRKIPVILVFEGWDAAGKGGTIKRLTKPLDPRGYEVIPIAAPNDIERAHHYLWRFWSQFPIAGHMAIFDRSWYGRVMVERIEGFCSEEEWKRAYSEINHMEENLSNEGYLIIKFWLHIDKEEQGKRFKERQENPDKQWKITEEDWRNREKWDKYEKAVDEMIVRTSTAYAPWVVVEANSKKYARIKVLETVVDGIEDYIKKYQ